MTKAEYREFLLNRISTFSPKHHLSIEEVLENQNRDQIIGLIIESPGIHFNQLMSKTELKPGNLVWHLDVLESYRIIKKKRVGQYITYYSYYYKNPFSEIDLLLQKNETTMKRLNFISENSGSSQKLIMKELNLKRSTAQYHLNKLLNSNIITKSMHGNKLLYDKFNAERIDDL